MNIRLARASDLMGMQACNLQNLPENYQMNFYFWHALAWPQLSYVAEDHAGRIVGYILAKIEEAEDGTPQHGHVNSISVLRSHRRRGVARTLMVQSQDAMRAVYRVPFVSLHVRRTNRAALALYRDALGFDVHAVDKAYYGDGEDAYHMRLALDSSGAGARPAAPAAVPGAAATPDPAAADPAPAHPAPAATDAPAPAPAAAQEPGPELAPAPPSAVASPSPSSS